MPELENLKNKLIEEDAEKANEIIKKAEDESKEIIKKAEDKGNVYISDMIKKAEKDGIEAKSKVMETIRIEIRDSLLRAKQETLNKAFKKTIVLINEMPKEDFQNLISKLIIKNIVTGNEKVLVSKDEKRLDSEFITKVNEEIRKLGKTGSLKIEFVENIKESGFILKRDDIEVNCTFEEILRMNKYELESCALEVLFK